MESDDLPPFLPQTRRDGDGGIRIESRIAPPRGRRKDYERQFFRGVEVGLPGWHRAHSQGRITGHESPNAIRYAPEEVNQAFQRCGIERFVRELLEEKASDVDLRLTTVTYTHADSLRLKEIQYVVTAWRGSESWKLYEAYIEVGDSKDNPRITPDVRLRTPREQWERFLRSRARP